MFNSFDRFPRDSSQGIPLHDGAIIMKIHFKSKGNINISVLVPAVIIVIIATIMVAIKEDNNNCKCLYNNYNNISS